MKGRAIADHLAHCSLEEAEEIQWDFPDEDIMGIELDSWKMYFDGEKKIKMEVELDFFFFFFF